MSGQNNPEQLSASGRKDAPSFDECEHLHMLGRINASRNQPAFGVDFGELKYRVLGRLISRGLVTKTRAYRYGENRTRTGYWLTRAGWAFLDGDAKLSSTKDEAATHSEPQSPSPRRGIAGT